MTIFCCQCQSNVQARLTSGTEVYPHRVDLKSLPFWICDECKNFVGCHHKTEKPTTPLGVIASHAIKDIRKQIHAVIDPLWKNSNISRGKVYALLSKELGYVYHTGEIRSEEEGMRILKLSIHLSKTIRYSEQPI